MKLTSATAKQIVLVALESKAITLRGSTNTNRPPTVEGAADAEYLMALLDTLTGEQPRRPAE